jgi:hypothetical protein
MQVMIKEKLFQALIWHKKLLICRMRGPVQEQLRRVCDALSIECAVMQLSSTKYIQYNNYFTKIME